MNLAVDAHLRNAVNNDLPDPSTLGALRVQVLVPQLVRQGEVDMVPVMAAAPLSPALGDTGAGANVISKREAVRLNLPVKPLSNPVTLKGCENSNLNTIGKVFIPLALSNPQTYRNNQLVDSKVTYNTMFFVVENLTENIILGTPFFKSNRAKFDFHTQRLHLTSRNTDVS